MNSTRAAAARTHAVLPLSVNGVSAATKVIALMARTMGAANFGRSHRLLRACKQRRGGVSGWFRARGTSACWKDGFGPPAREVAGWGHAEGCCGPEGAGKAAWPRATSAAGSRDDRVDERLGVEGREVVGPLAQAHELDRHPELALHRHDDATLRGAVELGEHDAGDVHRLGEDLRLLEAVLARRRVEDEQHLVDRALLLDDALDLAELVHEVDLVVQAAGRVDDDDVDLLL